MHNQQGMVHTSRMMMRQSNSTILPATMALPPMMQSVLNMVDLAVGETVILLHPLLPLVVVNTDGEGMSVK